MHKAWTPGLVAALTMALCMTAVGGTEQRRMADAGVNATPYYVRGPRIIHVPQPGDEIAGRGDIPATVDRGTAAALSDDDTGNVTMPPPRGRAPAPKYGVDSKRAAPKSAAKKTPRWKLRSEAPPPAPTGPRRAVLSAPPPRADGLSPIYPTPRFEANAKAGERFERPHQTETAAGPPRDAMEAPLSNELPPVTEN